MKAAGREIMVIRDLSFLTRRWGAVSAWGL